MSNKVKRIAITWCWDSKKLEMAKIQLVCVYMYCAFSLIKALLLFQNVFFLQNLENKQNVS